MTRNSRRDFYRNFRFIKDLTQEEMAEAAGVSASAISTIENGVRAYNRKVDLWIVEVSEDPRSMARFLRMGDSTDV